MEEAKYDYLYGEVNDALNETKQKKTIALVHQTLSVPEENQFICLHMA